ncbi:MAG: HAMP domain-containing histidine kinase [Caldilineaceae bacterium]|nr:HAMP domain-containing histidine kinase [Caldilineaceae bacterium]
MNRIPTRLILPKRQPLYLSLRFLAGVILTFALTLFLFVIMMQPVLAEFGEMTLLLGATAGVSLIAGLAAYYFGWFERSRRLAWTLLGGYLLSSLLTLLNVMVTTWRMFIEPHDRSLATILLLFATSIAMALGYFLSMAVTDKVGAVGEAARAIARGQLRTRVQVPGRDEVAELAHSFNEMAEQLEQADRQQRELEQLRRNLIAWVGHDLRTPLASVRAMVEALADGMVDDPATQQRYLRTAQRDIHALSLLIDNLFEMAQIDAGGLPLDRQPNALSDLLSDTLESFQSLANEKGVLLAGDVEPGIDPVWIDARLIGRVLTNLVGNAIRHTPQGGYVHLAARPLGDWVEVTVRDSGEGIQAADLPRIFDQFYRAEKSRSRATGGAGLGLAIAKSFVEAHGGQIHVASRPGQGTQFTFTLPRATTSPHGHPLRKRVEPPRKTFIRSS